MVDMGNNRDVAQLFQWRLLQEMSRNLPFGSKANVHGVKLKYQKANHQTSLTIRQYVSCDNNKSIGELPTSQFTGQA